MKQTLNQKLKKRLGAIRHAHIHIEKQKALLIQQELNLVNETRSIYERLSYD